MGLQKYTTIKTMEEIPVAEVILDDTQVVVTLEEPSRNAVKRPRNETCQDICTFIWCFPFVSCLVCLCCGP